MEQGLSRYEQAALDVVHESTSQVVAARQAEVRLRPCAEAPVGNVGDHLIELVPTNPKACSMSIFPTESQIDLWLGKDEVLDEIWQKDHEERLRELRLRVVAVVAGNYEERWHQKRFWPFRPFTQLVGTFHQRLGTWCCPGRIPAMGTRNDESPRIRIEGDDRRFIDADWSRSRKG